MFSSPLPVGRGSLHSSDDARVDTVVNGAPAAQIIDRLAQALHDGANGDAFASLLYCFVRIVARIQVGENAHCRSPSDRVFGTLELDRRDIRVHSGIELDGALTMLHAVSGSNDGESQETDADAQISIALSCPHACMRAHKRMRTRTPTTSIISPGASSRACSVAARTLSTDSPDPLSPVA